MADEAGGLLAIMGPEKEGKSDKAGSAKERALKGMYQAMKSGDWATAAEEFQTAYDECAMGPGDDEDEEE